MGEKAHTNSKNKGFWDHTFNIPAKMEATKEFTSEEIQAVRAAFSSQKLLLIVSEIGEAMEADRKGRYGNIPEFEARLEEVNASTNNPTIEVLEGNFRQLFESRLKDTKGDELADGLIRLVEYCEGEGIALTSHALYKMRYNEGRPKMHGKAY